VDLLEKAANLLPTAVTYAYECGLGLQLLKRAEEAQQYYEKAIKIDPTAFKPYSLLGSLLLTRGKTEEGLQYLETALTHIQTVTSEHINCIANVGITHFLKKNFTKAEEVFLKGVHLDHTLLPKIIQCYSAQNKIAERDNAIEELYKLKREGKITQPQFCREQVFSPGGTIIISEYFDFSGAFGACKYLFLWENHRQMAPVQNNQIPFRVSVGSYDLTNSFAQLPPPQRIWHLDAYYLNNSHATIDLMTLTETPKYDTIRNKCIQALIATGTRGMGVNP